MAGFYPDVPGQRFAYDRDGSVGLLLSGGFTNVARTWTTTEAQQMNNESANNLFGIDDSQTRELGLIFPEPRTITGMTFADNNESVFGLILEVSSDSTNCIDGTWQSVTYPRVIYSSTALRNNIQSVALNDVKAMRWSVSNTSTGGMWYQRCVHIYGELPVTSSPDRLRLWHPTLDQPLDASTDGAYLDWGDAIQGTSQDKTFRVKNNSATLSANSIALSPEVLTDTTPTVLSQHTLSDGGAFAQTINIGSLAPGQISGIITFRRSTLSNAALSLWTGRININPGSWS